MQSKAVQGLDFEWKFYPKRLIFFDLLNSKFEPLFVNLHTKTLQTELTELNAKMKINQLESSHLWLPRSAPTNVIAHLPSLFQCQSECHPVNGNRINFLGRRKSLKRSHLSSSWSIYQRWLSKMFRQSTPQKPLTMPIKSI